MTRIKRCEECEQPSDHQWCLRCAEPHVARPYDRYNLDVQDALVGYVQGINGSGDESVDLASVYFRDAPHPLLTATPTEIQDIYNRMAFGLTLTHRELDTIIAATAKVDPALAKRLRATLDVT